MITIALYIKPEKDLEFFKLMISKAFEFEKDKDMVFGKSEPYKEKFTNIDDLLKFIEKSFPESISFQFRSTGNIYNLMYVPSIGFGELRILIQDNPVDRSEEIKSLFLDLVSYKEICLYGRVYTKAEFDFKHMYGKYDPQGKQLKVSDGQKIINRGLANKQKGLPGIYWLNFWSAFIVNHLGKDKITKVLEDLRLNYSLMENDSIYFVTRTEPSEFSEEKHMKVKDISDALGGEYFYDKYKPDQDTKSPLIEYFKKYNFVL